MNYRLVAVPEDRLLVTGSSAMVLGELVPVSPADWGTGPFEVVDRRNAAMLLASVEGPAAASTGTVAVSRSDLAVLLQYASHVAAASRIGESADAELVQAIRSLNEELAR